MIDNNPTGMTHEEDSIDIIALLKTIWSGRKLVVKSIAVFFIIGCIVALSSPVIYTSETTFVPQTSDDQMSAPKGLGSLAGRPGLFQFCWQSATFLYVLSHLVCFVHPRMKVMDNHQKSPEIIKITKNHQKSPQSPKIAKSEIFPKEIQNNPTGTTSPPHNV